MTFTTRLAVAATVAVLIAACAAPQRAEFRPVAPLPSLVWPQQPDVPRLRFAGALLGETNYVRPETRRSFLDWLIGLNRNSDGVRVLSRPSTGLVDSKERILVVDSGRGAIFVFAPDANDVAIWEYGAANQPFAAPVAIAELPGGDFIVSDAEAGKLFRLGPTGEPMGEWGDEYIARPTGLAWSDQANALFVADTAAHQIFVLAPSGERLEVIGGPGVEPGQFNAPTHLAVDDSGLWVSDTFNARVQHLTLDGEPTEVFGKRGLNVGNMTRPKGIAVLDDTVFVVESLHDHLLIFSRQGEYLLPVGGSGNRPGEFYLPSGIWTHRDRLYVADMFNGRIVMFDFLGGS